MHNQPLADIFERMAEILELKSDPADRFRIRAYQRASLIMRELPEDVEALYKNGELKKTPGIGTNLYAKIEEYLKTGKIPAYEKLKKLFPETLINLLNIQHLGPKKLGILHVQFGVHDVDSLKEILESGEVESYPGFGAKSVQNILDGIQLYKGAQERTLLGDIYWPVHELVEYMKTCQEVDQIEPAGSFRRKKETIGDIDILTCGKKREIIMDHFVKCPEVKTILAQGETKGSVILENGTQVDLRIVDKSEWGSALQYFTGSKQHNVHMRSIAKAKGLKVNEYGAFKEKKRIAGETEESMYKVLGMQLMPPEMREDRGEIDAALKRKIPKLLELKDIKGDFHVHSTWSDGGNTVEEMAEAALEKGYEYLAITDHSKHLRVANGMTEEELVEKRKEITAVNKKFKNITVLCGTEVDILDNGQLDYADEVLKSLDFVIAAIHNKMRQDNTQRILKAMENPYVHAIGHVSGRRMGMRDAYPLDYQAVFKKAKETNTLIELNAQPERMDLADKYIKEAKDMGIKFVIGTDAHQTATLWLMEIGVSLARRGWLTKNDVVNCWGWGKVRKYIV